MKLSEYTEEDLLKAFRKESYALGELNHLKTRQRIVRYRRQHALVVFDKFDIIYFRTRSFQLTRKHIGGYPWGVPGKIFMILYNLTSASSRKFLSHISVFLHIDIAVMILNFWTPGSTKSLKSQKKIQQIDRQVMAIYWICLKHFFLFQEWPDKEYEKCGKNHWLRQRPRELHMLAWNNLLLVSQFLE